MQPKNKPVLTSLFSLILVVSLTSAFAQDHWTHFRGSNLDGISPDSLVPVTWNDTTNIVWKTDIRGRGWSSPVVDGNQIWLTTATTDGKEMSGICIDFNTGKLLYDILLFRQDSIYHKHPVNTFATPTPCIGEGFVYMNFGSTGTACIRTSDGTTVWKRDDLKVDHMQGPGSSPILYKDFLIVHYEGTDQQFIVAMDKRTGKTIWRTDRPGEYYDRLQPVGKKAYVTPIIICVAGKDLLISNGAAVCNAFDVMTGKEVWRVIQGEDSTISMPVFEDGIVYFYTSFVTPPEGEKYAELVAVDPAGEGDITGTNVLWRLKSPVLQLLTPLVKDGIIYTVDTRNNLLGIDAKTGTAFYSKKLRNKYNSSPVYAGGRVYFSSVKGETLVLKAGRNPEVLAENILTGEIFATPAIVRNSILIRNETTLYRIGSKEE
ncbi:MAG TPA: PQQ-binding-like beta-propeller repeat protein [Prolixibacteraceae bacterium]|nr:PQQ-binding-like beta-propeller repeat protein [Prolixibacteraceae bacterium]